MTVPYKPAQIEVSVRVSDGSFETHLSWPIETSSADVDRLVQTWIQMIHQAVEMGHRNVSSEKSTR